MEKTMRAAVFHEYGSAEVLKIEEVAIPQPEPDEILLRVQAIGLNHLDLLARAGLGSVQVALPHIGGSEAAGEIVQLGASVKGFELGQPVVVAPYYYDGSCTNCIAGEETTCLNGGMLGLSTDGSYAEYVKVPAKNLVKIPEEVSFEEAVAQSLTTITAWHMLVAKAGVRPGEIVLVQAAGSGVGSAAIQVAKLWGAQVIAIAANNTKLDKAVQAGADETINYHEIDLVTELNRLTEGRGADIVVEQVGGATWEKSLDCVARNGRLVLCGATSGAEVRINLEKLFSRQIMVIGSNGGTREELKEVLRFTAEGRLNATIDQVFPLEQIVQAQKYLESRQQYGKVLVKP